MIMQRADRCESPTLCCHDVAESVRPEQDGGTLEDSCWSVMTMARSYTLKDRLLVHACSMTAAGLWTAFEPFMPLPLDSDAKAIGSAAPSAPIQYRTSYRGRSVTPKNWAIAGIMTLSFVTGALGQFFYPGSLYSPADMWSLPVFTLLVLMWYRLDSTQRAYDRSPWLSICIVGIAFIALPYYLFRSRGLKRGLIATAVMVGLLVLSGVLTALGQQATYHVLQLPDVIQSEASFNHNRSLVWPIAQAP